MALSGVATGSSAIDILQVKLIVRAQTASCSPSFTSQASGARAWGVPSADAGPPPRARRLARGAAIFHADSPVGLMVDGKVGIGTTSPLGLLEVKGKLTVLSGVNVDIGATAPHALVNIMNAGSSDTGLLKLRVAHTTTGSQVGIWLTNDTDSTISGAKIIH